MAQYGFVMDVSRCVGCYGCFVACKDEYWGNDYLPNSLEQPRHGQFWMNIRKRERGSYPYIKVAYMPVPCMHCDEAPCVHVAQEGAVYKRKDGIVLIDPVKAVGQRQIVDSCPYGAVYWNEEKNLPQKCTLCAHRLDKGEMPRCVEACPSDAIRFGDLDEPYSEVSRLLKSGKCETFHPEYHTAPRAHYMNLHRITRHFVGASVVFGDVDECAEGVTATLKGPDHRSGKIRTNNYGMFEFDGLDAGKYSLRLECENYRPKSLDVNLGAHNNYLGEIILERIA
jgi:Fe-S-cluster-containing dehydrogenase component